jgi:hypothetical protein
LKSRFDRSKVLYFDVTINGHPTLFTLTPGFVYGHLSTELFIPSPSASLDVTIGVFDVVFPVLPPDVLPDILPEEPSEVLPLEPVFVGV